VSDFSESTFSLCFCKTYTKIGNIYTGVIYRQYIARDVALSSKESKLKGSKLRLNSMSTFGVSRVMAVKIDL